MENRNHQFEQHEHRTGQRYRLARHLAGRRQGVELPLEPGEFITPGRLVDGRHALLMAWRRREQRKTT